VKAGGGGGGCWGGVVEETCVVNVRCPLVILVQKTGDERQEIPYLFPFSIQRIILFFFFCQ
jgi:hypothetical protein